MANREIQIKRIDERVSRVRVSLEMEILKVSEREVRKQVENALDEIQDNFEKIDELALIEVKIKATEPTPIAKIIKSKGKGFKIPKQPKKKLKLTKVKVEEIQPPEQKAEV
jgi:hypothetical protein